MCCHGDRQSLAEFRRRYAGRKRIVAWKKVRSDGLSLYARFQYRPGTFEVPVRRYDTYRPKGFHVWLGDPPCWATMDSIGLLKVYVRPEDVVRCAFIGSPYTYEAVFRRISISKAAWLRAGLKLPKKARGKK
mgnify:CR=1 FL=1